MVFSVTWRLCLYGGINSSRGSPTLFSWRVNSHFCFAWNVNEDLVFPWFVNLYFSVHGKLLFDFFVIREICVYFRVIFEATTFAGIILHFFGDFSVIKACKLHQTGCKAWPFDELADGGLGTNHSDSNLENHGQESWDKFALLALLRTRLSTDANITSLA